MTSPSPARRLSTNSPQRAAVAVLAGGAALALAAAIGGVWIVRVGVVLAVAAGAIACALLIRAARAERHRASSELVATSRRQRESLSVERAHHGEVLDVLSRANSRSAETISELRSEIGGLRTALATARGDQASSVIKLEQRDQTIARLRQDLAAREAELQSLTKDDAEVVALPRRAAADAAQADALPSAEDLWINGNHPTVVQLAAISDLLPAEQRRQA